MARRRKNQDELQENKVPSLSYSTPSQAYSQDALNALASGNYREFRKSGVAARQNEQAKQGFLDKKEWRANTDVPSLANARQYQQNLDDRQKSYEYDEQARKNNTLEKRDSWWNWEQSDQDYLQRIYDNFGEEGARRALQQSSRTKDWEQKYGKSYDQILNDFLADQKNVTMQMGESHPFLTEAGTILNSVPNALVTLPSLITNLVDPESPTAKKYEQMRANTSENQRLLREGVKKNTGNVGDKVIDTINGVGDRMANTIIGNQIAPGLGAVMAGLSDANTQLDDLDLRGVTGRQKYASALTHGAVEGIGTAITGGLLDKIPAVEGVKGALLNIGKGAGNAAIENTISELVEMGADTAINKDKSQKELNKAMYMAQGMSEEDASKQAFIDQAKQAGYSALTGALFGGGMRGLTEIGNGLNGNKVPTLDAVDDVAEQAAKTADDIPTVKTNNVEVPPTEAEIRAGLDANKKVAPEQPKGLQGEEFDKAKAEFDANKKTISDLQKENKSLKKLKQTKANKAKIADNDAKIKDLKRKNVLLDRDMYGKPTPVIEQLDSSTVDNIKYYQKQLRDAGNMFGGEDGKALAKEANDALDRYVESGNMDDLMDFSNKLEALQSVSRGKVYTKKNGEELTFESFFGGEQGLADSFENNPAMRAIYDFHNPKAEAAGESTPTNIEPEPVEPEIPTLKTTDVPQQEMPTLNQPTATTAPYDNPGEGSDISKRYYSMKNSDLFQRSEANMKMLESAKESGAFNKGVEGRLQAQEDALNEYIADPAKAKRDNLTKQWTGGKDIDTAMLVLHDALEDGNQTDFNLAAMKQAEQLKQAGRELRATRDYAGTKEGTLSKAVEFLNDKADKILSSKKTKEMLDGIAERAINGDYAALKQSDMDDAAVDSIRKAVDAGASKDDVAKMIAMYRAVGKTGISSEALQKVNAIYDQITRENLSPTSKRRADLETDAFKVLASDIGGKRSWGEMWNAWRYLAMLGNPKTHLRNVIGNTTHYMVTEAKDNVAAVMEEAIDKMNRGMGGQGIERTKALLSGEDQGLIDKAVKDADDVAYAALNDSGNKYNVKNEIDRARNAFNNKALSKIDDLNSNLLDVEDYSALKRKYSRSMARYLKANGADESIFSATDDASKALLDRARAYAIDQAKQATFHEYSKLADSLTQFSNNMRSDGKPVHKAVGMITEGLLPFKKTPINILKQGGKYSPISIAKGLYKVFDSVKTGNSTASEAIEDLASGLTGTGIMGLGYFLAHEGFLTGGANEDYDVDNAETDQGKQNYALKIGNKSYTLDWLAPLSLPLFVGVELQKMMNEEDDPDKDVFDKAFTALSNIAEPITEMSMLQGIQNVLNELSYSRDNVLATFAANTATGYLSQGVPTLAGQVARAVDDTRRSTYSDQPTGFKRQFDKAWTKIENKVPFLSMMNEPYVDSRGNTQQNEGIFTANLGNNFGTRLLDQMLSPGYYKEGNITDTDRELNRLYEATGEDVYQNVASGKLQDGSRLSKEKFTEYQELYGKNTENFYDAMIQSDVYQQLDDAEKVETLNSLKTLSKNIADHEISGKELQKSQQKIYDIYKQQGVNGVIDYYETKAKADSLGMQVSTYEKKEAEYEGGAAAYAQSKQTADSLGIKTSTYDKVLEKAGLHSSEAEQAIPALVGMGLPTNALYTYANALNDYEDINPNEFAATYNEMNTDNSNGLKEKEILDYINSFEYDDPSEAEDLWYMYSDFTNKKGERKKIKNVDGVWKSYY